MGDEANFKIETAPAVYDVWYLGWPHARHLIAEIWIGC